MLQTLLLSLGFGLITASVLAIAAVGITLQFGVTNYLNLAYGDLLTFGVYAAFVVNQHLGLSIWIALLAAIVLTSLLAWLIKENSILMLLTTTHAENLSSGSTIAGMIADV